MVSKQFSKFKQSIAQKVFTDKQNLTKDVYPTTDSSPITFKNSPSPSSDLKIDLFSIITQSKKNSTQLNSFSKNNNSPLGFRQTQTTNYTERNDTEESQIQTLKTEVQSPRIQSFKQNRDRINTTKTLRNENNEKLQNMKVITDLFEKKRISKQSSIHQLKTQQSQSRNESPQHCSFKNMGQKSPSFHSTVSQQLLPSPIIPPLNLNYESQNSKASPCVSNYKIQTPRLKTYTQNSQLINSPTASPLKQQPLTQRLISEINQKKTPFTNICKQITTNMMNLFKRIKSKVQFFNHITKLLINRSHYLQGIFLIPEIQEVVQDSNIVEKSLIHIVSGVEFRNSNQAQKGIIKTLLIELSILNKEIFEIFLAQSKQEIKNIREKIEYEREEVEFLTTHLKQKHYPNFSQKATLYNALSYNSQPITYKKEKYNLVEEKFGKFDLISQENRFMCSEIEKIVCDLNQVNYKNNIPRRNVNM